MGVCDNGIASPWPPCFQFRKFRSVCETSKLCFTMGGCGPTDKPTLRSRVMLTATVVSFLCFLLQLIPVISISSDTQVVKDTHWIKGRGDFIDPSGARQDATLYISVDAIVVEVGNGTQVTRKWSGVDCNFAQCQSCKDSAADTIITAIMSLVTSIPQITTDIQRSTLAGDLNCQRTLGMVTAIFGFITTIIAIRTFINKCGDEFAEDVVYPDGSRATNTKYQFGPSLICLTIATFLKFFDFACNFVIKTPSLKRGDMADSLFALPFGKLQEKLEDAEQGIEKVDGATGNVIHTQPDSKTPHHNPNNGHHGQPRMLSVSQV